MRTSGLVIALMAAVAAAGCGGTSYGSTGPTNSPTTSSTGNAVNVGDNYFSPAATTVPVGTSVTWTWSGSISHNVTFDDGAGSTTQAAGTYARTFTAVGTYAYHCTVHGAAMSGSVKVQ